LEHDRLLDLLFRFFTSWGLRVIPKLFQRDMHRCLSLPSSLSPLKTAHYSPMLHNALLAVATAFSDDPAIKDPLTRQQFADKAKSYLEDECERPKLSAMTALSILANYHSSENHATLGYIYFGICARMSQALGLGIDCSPWVEAGLITHAGMMDRNWALWTTFCQDTTWSLYVGRDFCTASSVDPETIPVPFVSPDLDQYLGSWPLPNGEIVHPKHISGTFAATCSLMQIARDISDVVSNFSRLGDRQDTTEFRIAQMDLKLSTWKNDLPSEIDLVKSNPSPPQPHELMLHMTYHWLTILLHRPFYRRRRSCDDINHDTDHIKPCNRAAAEIMELAQIWRGHFKLRYVPITMIQVISAAATIFVVAAVQAVSGPRIAHGALESAEKSAETTIQYLREVGESFASATSVADILQHLLQQQVQTRKARRSPGASPGLPIFPWNQSSSSTHVTRGNIDSTFSWLEPISAPVDSVHTSFPDSQPANGYPSCQYSSLAGALSPGAALNYSQPFGDGLGELPVNIGTFLGGGPGSMFSTDSLMMFSPPQQVFNPSYQSGAPNHYASPH
jgi:hypothetical protein